MARKQRREEESGDLSGRLVTLLEPSNVTSEAYRTLRTNLIYSITDKPPKVIVLTSSGPREGKSTTCANLGVVLSQADKKTLILDCDLRKPVMHRFFGLRNIYGLMNVLAEEYSLREALEEPLNGLNVLPVGPIPPNPAEVLSSQHFVRFLDQVRKEFDYVLIDAPPISPVSDPIILASHGDGVLLVLDEQNTGKGAVLRSQRSLESVGATVIGTIMNNVKGTRGRYYQSYTYE